MRSSEDIGFRIFSHISGGENIETPKQIVIQEVKYVKIKKIDIFSHILGENIFVLEKLPPPI